MGQQLQVTGQDETHRQPQRESGWQDHESERQAYQGQEIRWTSARLFKIISKTKDLIASQ